MPKIGANGTFVKKCGAKDHVESWDKKLICVKKLAVQTQAKLINDFRINKRTTFIC